MHRIRTLPRFFLLLLFTLLLPLGAVLAPTPVRAEDPPEAPEAPETVESVEPAGPARYVRLDDLGDHLVLKVAARELVPVDGEGPRLWLVGALHIADAGYYDAVQALLDTFDLLLYESVKPEGAGKLRLETAAERVGDTKQRLAFLAGVVHVLMKKHEGPPPETREAFLDGARSLGARLADFVDDALLDAWGHGLVYGRRGDTDAYAWTSLGADGEVGGEGEAADLEAGVAEGTAFYDEVFSEHYNLQKELAIALDLSWQLKGVDYDRAHFVPSDMALDEVLRAIEARDGDPAFLDRALSGGGFSGAVTRFVIGLLKFGDRLSGGRLSVIMKMVLVTMLSDPALEEGRVEGIDKGTMEAILFDRNAVVLDDLDRILGADEKPGTIGVFYGAAHMRDLERHLLERGYEPGETRWLPAVDVDLGATGLAREQLDRMREGLEKTLRERVPSPSEGADDDR